MTSFALLDSDMTLEDVRRHAPHLHALDIDRVSLLFYKLEELPWNIAETCSRGCAFQNEVPTDITFVGLDAETGLTLSWYIPLDGDYSLERVIDLLASNERYDVIRQFCNTLQTDILQPIGRRRELIQQELRRLDNEVDAVSQLINRCEQNTRRPALRVVTPQEGSTI